MIKLTIKDLYVFISWGIKLYPCKIIQDKRHKVFSFPKNGSFTREWNWIKENPQISPEEIISYLEQDYQLAGILIGDICVLDCDDKNAFEFIFNYLEKLNITSVSEKSLNYDNLNLKHHYYFKAKDIPYCTKFDKLGFQGKGELLGKGHLIFINKDGWYLNPSELNIPDLPENIRITHTNHNFIGNNSFKIPKGERNIRMYSLSGSMRRFGATLENIIRCLQILNNQCNPPLSNNELINIAHSISKYPPQPIDNSYENIINKMKGLL